MLIIPGKGVATRASRSGDSLGTEICSYVCVMPHGGVGDEPSSRSKGIADMTETGCECEEKGRAQRGKRKRLGEGNEEL